LRSEFALKARPPGPEFLDAETKRQKPSFKRANASGDQKPVDGWLEIPAETPNLASYRKPAVCGDWIVEVIGLELETHRPVIEPVSAERIVGQAEFGRLLMFFCP
jgi:hypothetical protein